MPGTPAEERLRRTGALQRCPNCEARTDVSFCVAGALVRCGRCGLRFQVQRSDAEVRRRTSPPPARPRSMPVRPLSPEDPGLWEELAAVGNPNSLPADPAAVVAAEPSPAVATPPAPPVPALDGFALFERLGQGGMGEVYRAIRLADGRPVAVKVLSAALAAVPDYVRRFDREAAAMAQLDHPGIVRLLSRGRSGAHCWIAMELIEGLSLRVHAARARPSARALARLLAQVAHALAYAHARAVVHRDLKPDNVLVLTDGKTKVLDFGLAGLHAEGAEVLTQSNVAMGTANYMAPEQRKDARRADHRADLYSFGVMTYELLTGELPVGRFQPACRLVPGLERGWDSLIERCLEQDPAARPHSALELAHALEALGGRAPALELAPRTRRRAQRSRVWSWLGIGSGIAVVLAMACLRVAHDHGGAAAAPAARAEIRAAPAARAVNAVKKLRR